MSLEEDVKAQKGLLREQVGESIETLSDAAKAQESERICWILEGLLHPPRKECIAVYFPLSDEPDILPLIEAMLRAGQPLCLPRTELRSGAGALRDGELVMYMFDSLDSLVKGPFGNLEPKPDSKPEPEPEIILVPGRAFDRSGNRLGRGLGFYDCFIASLRGGEAEPPPSRGRTSPPDGRPACPSEAPRPTASGRAKERRREVRPPPEFLGVCFSCQLLENIPALPHDQKVDRVVSAEEIISA